MKIRGLKPESGETLVEVLAASAIFLLMMAIMQGAISFCTNAQHKSRQLRTVNAQICRDLKTTTYAVTAGKATFRFEASASGQTGGITLFEIPVELTEKKVPYENADGTSGEAVFYLFRPETSGAGGGGGP